MAYAGKPEVFDVLERQGRSALLPEAVISAILGHLKARVTYAPIQCQDVVLNPAADMGGSSI
ncbi:hypothetical protein KIN20_007504 [Parelaphostrongylus tenuis]|uniref:Uncharacterized protein n=1 Tax=Parelaphostrongylus tenuis TaxID=148309 RepID=A0AAD5QK31_PARTN|nr:hypothetical protein KIN20_007504 [Parelaphostrongylus tenuis]